MFTQKFNKQAMCFTCIVDELSSVVEALAVDADDFVVVVQKLDVRHGSQCVELIGGCVTG